MWVKTVDGKYYNVTTGSILSIEKGSAGDYRVYVSSGNNPVTCLQNGFKSKDDAVEALDGVMEDQEVVVIDVPEYDDEEDSEEDGELSEEDDDGDVIVFEDDYAEMTNTQLRQLLADRPGGLSTEGNKNALIERLREDDVRGGNEEGVI